VWFCLLRVISLLFGDICVGCCVLVRSISVSSLVILLLCGRRDCIRCVRWIVLVVRF